MATIETFAAPSRLYRYRSLANDALAQELEAVVKSYVYCPGYAQMNDPMEGNHATSAMLRKDKSYDSTLKKVTSAKAELGIASFSEFHRSEPMWAQYAGNFSGLCIAYNLSRLLRGLSGGEFVQMAYSEKAPVLLKGRKTAAEMAKFVLSTKSIRWMPEREWRLIMPSKGPAPYGETNCVAAVYLGPRMTEAHRSLVRRELKSLTIPIWEMSIDKYEMAFHQPPLPGSQPPSQKRFKLKVS